MHKRKNAMKCENNTRWKQNRELLHTPHTYLVAVAVVVCRSVAYCRLAQRVFRFSALQLLRDEKHLCSVRRISQQSQSQAKAKTVPRIRGGRPTRKVAGTIYFTLLDTHRFHLCMKSLLLSLSLRFWARLVRQRTKREHAHYWNTNKVSGLLFFRCFCCCCCMLHFWLEIWIWNFRSRNEINSSSFQFGYLFGETVKSTL